MTVQRVVLSWVACVYVLFAADGAWAQSAWGNYDDEPSDDGVVEGNDEAGGAWGHGGSGASANAGGTCEGACVHYLSCAGSADAQALQECLVACVQLGLTREQLVAFEAADCATTLATVRQLEGGGQGGSQGGGTNCQGCVRDGEYCVWMSQSNWGEGPYSGAVVNCDPACCR